MEMEFRILGPLEVRAAGNTVALGGAKQRALVLLLMLHANDVVAADRLVDALWPDRPPAAARHALQVYVSKLRKQLDAAADGAGDARLVTQPPGYLLRVEPGELDVERFERLIAEGRSSLERDDPTAAAATLREALALWRGSPLSEFVYEPFAQPWIARLEEVRLAAVEDRVDADLASGRHRELVAELEALAATDPLRERVRGQLMLALYRSGRHADALEVFQQTRRALVDELGIDPSPALQRLERAILLQDEGLELERAPTTVRSSDDLAAPPRRSIVVAFDDEELLGGLLSLVEPLATTPTAHELIVLHLLPPPGRDRRRTELARAASSLAEQRTALLARGADVRVAAFASSAPGRELGRFLSHEDVDLSLVCADWATFEIPSSPDLASLVSEAPCDVAVVTRAHITRVGMVLVPFGGGEHDWAALELGAWLAKAHACPLRLVGAVAAGGEADHDGSRVLAHAALAVQRLVHVVTEPVLVEPGPEGVLSAVNEAAVLVVGFGDRPLEEGLGRTRATLARESPVPTLFVRGGLRPGGLAPADGLTRVTWSLGAGA